MGSFGGPPGRAFSRTERRSFFFPLHISDERQSIAEHLQSRIEYDDGKEKDPFNEDECDTQRECPSGEEFMMQDASLRALPFVEAKDDQSHYADDECGQNSNVRPCPRIAAQTESSQEESETGR